jgi:hypothetical protein
MGPVNSLGELVQERSGLTTEKYKSICGLWSSHGSNACGSAADSGDCARFWQLDFGPLGEGFNTQLVTPHRCFNIVAEYITFVCTGIRLNFPVFYLLIVVLRTT